MSKLRVRVYNVLFGDAILVSVPDKDRRKTVIRHILIDVGNVLAGSGGDEVFEPIIRDIKKEIGDRPLDLYVMTHEHLDHVKGLLYASKNLGLNLDVEYAWLTASAAEDYYDRYPEAKKKRALFSSMYERIEQLLHVSPQKQAPLTKALLMNNNPQHTEDCVKYLREIARHTAYVYRGCDLKTKHPFKEARFEIWAPEEDTSDYYGRLQPVAFNLEQVDKKRPQPLSRPMPPPGVDAGSFYNLVDARLQGYSDNLISIDKALNNTSVVFCLEWRGWRLLFAGDAEQKSWKTMWKTLNEKTALRSIHFLKIAHHGSRNGLPPPDMLDVLLPRNHPDKRSRYAVLSTCLETYNNVPDEVTLEELSSRCEVKSVLELKNKEFYFDVMFKP